MKFAIVDGQRSEAEPRLRGECPNCGSAVIAKCGEFRIWHWAHGIISQCDHWWENETEWHRNWKNKFPAEWQEIGHISENGEKHIADVKTKVGCVVEFQHSYLQPQERRSRQAFYKPMIWVVNGLRRKHDKDDFYRSLSAARVIKLKPLTYELTAAGGALLRDWIGCREAVYFDFGDESSSLFGVPVLWRLSPTSCARRVILSPVPVANFVEALLNGVKAKGINMLVSKIPAPRLTPLVRIPLRGFQAHLARKRWRQSRRRF